MKWEVKNTTFISVNNGSDSCILNVEHISMVNLTGSNVQFEFHGGQTRTLPFADRDKAVETYSMILKHLGFKDAD